MSKFKVGEVAIIILASDKYNYLIGRECEIIRKSNKEGVDWIIDINHAPAPTIDGWSAPECALKKLPPKDTPTSWESMSDIFKPKILETSA